MPPDPTLRRRRRARAVNRGTKAVTRLADLVQHRQDRRDAVAELIYEAGGIPPSAEPPDTTEMLEAVEFADRVLAAAERLCYPADVPVDRLEDDADLVMEAADQLEV